MCGPAKNWHFSTTHDWNLQIGFFLVFLGLSEIALGHDDDEEISEFSATLKNASSSAFLQAEEFRPKIALICSRHLSWGQSRSDLGKVEMCILPPLLLEEEDANAVHF